MSATMPNKPPFVLNVKIALGIVAAALALGGPCVTFYAVSKVENAQLTLRVESLEKRVDKHDEALSNIPKQLQDVADRMSNKIDRMDEKVQSVVATTIQIKAQLDNGAHK